MGSLWVKYFKSLMDCFTRERFPLGGKPETLRGDPPDPVIHYHVSKDIVPKVKGTYKLTWLVAIEART